MVGKASKKGRGSASLLFVCANKGELGFSPSFTGSNKTPPLPSVERATPNRKIFPIQESKSLRETGTAPWSCDLLRLACFCQLAKSVDKREDLLVGQQVEK